MAVSSVPELCRLCFCCKLIKIESLQIKDILQKIKKYLLIQMEQASVALCADCYNSLEEFHRFYERVHAAQRTFLLLQTDVPQVDHVATPLTDQERWDDRQNDSEQTRENQVNKATADKPCDNANPKEISEEESRLKTQESSAGEKELKSETDQNGMRRERADRKSKASSEIENKMIQFYNVKCEKCENLKFTSFKALNRHYMCVHKTQGYIRCCKRNIKVNNKSFLRSHMLKHLEPDTCRCTICGKQLSSTITLKNHMFLHKPIEERPFQCSECTKRFCCKTDLNNHEKSLHAPENEKHFVCDVCGKVFQKVANLRYHQSTIHLQERKYVCELCPRCFTTQTGLKRHMCAAHDTKGPIQCRECNKWLKNEATFQKHLQLHQNNSYPCSQCSKVCNSSTSLRSHMVKHSENRPYSCPICRKSFKTRSHLKNHSSQHSGGTNYKCPFCSKAFVNMSNFYTHRRRMHYGESNCRKQREQPQEYKVVDSEVSVVRQNIIISPSTIKNAR